MKKSLIIVVCLLALSGLMASTAYSKAFVYNQTQVATVATDDALLALVPNPNFTEFADVVDNKLRIDFTRHGQTGMQPDSFYTFENLFYVKNNSDKPVKVGMGFDYHGVGKSAPAGLSYIYSGNKNLVTAANNVITGEYQDGTNRFVTIEPGQQVGISWRFDTAANQQLVDAENWRVIVHGTAYPTR